MTSRPAASSVHDEMAAVAGAQLLVGVEKLDAGDRAVGREIDVDLVADAHGLNLGRALAEADVGHVAAGIVGGASGVLLENLAITDTSILLPWGEGGREAAG